MITKEIIKKVVSMLVIVCLMMGVANIPVYAYTAVGPVEYSQEYNLQTEYVTPVQAVKKATAKPTATKKSTTIKKSVTKKTSSLTSQIISKYTSKGLKALRAVANKLGFSLKTVYNQFVKYGVTKKDMQKASNTLIKLVNRGVVFVNCVCLAVSKYLGISRNSAALQNLAADIAGNGEWFANCYSNERVVIASSHARTVLQKNGHKNADDYALKTKDFISNLKKGQKALVGFDCYDSRGRNIGGHEVMVQREKDGKYSVCDILINGGNKITYTATEFKKLMNGQSAKGKTSSGRTITKPVYLNSVDGYIRYKIDDGIVSLTTDSKSIAQVALKNTDAYKYTKEAIATADKLLKKKETSSLAKTWLKEFKKLVNNYLNSSKSYSEKNSFAFGISYAIKTIAEEKASIVSLIKYSTISASNSCYSGLYPLRKVLKDSIEYKIYKKYGEDMVSVIQNFSKYYNLKEDEVYNIFVKNKVTKTQLEDNTNHLGTLMYRMVEGFDIYEDPLIVSNDNIKKSLEEIKQLIEK